jgi:hypothetical protein
MSKTAQLRIAVCRIFHGSNSCSTTETDLSHSKNVNGVLVGSDVLTKRDSSDEITGFLRAIPPLGIVTV